MKITAFILSILLSTIALAEDHAEKYSDVNMEEVQQVIADGEVIDVEDKDGIVESVESAIGRELTEEEKDSIFSSIDKMQVARTEGTQLEYVDQDGISKDSQKCKKKNSTKDFITRIVGKDGNTLIAGIPVAAGSAIMSYSSFPSPWVLGAVAVVVVGSTIYLAVTTDDPRKNCSYSEEQQ